MQQQLPRFGQLTKLACISMAAWAIGAWVQAAELSTKSDTTLYFNAHIFTAEYAHPYA